MSLTLKKPCLFTLDLRIQQQSVRLPIFDSDSSADVLKRLQKKHSHAQTPQIAAKLAAQLTKTLSRAVISERVKRKIESLIRETKENIPTLPNEKPAENEVASADTTIFNILQEKSEQAKWVPVYTERDAAQNYKQDERIGHYDKNIRPNPPVGKQEQYVLKRKYDQEISELRQQPTEQANGRRRRTNIQGKYEIKGYLKREESHYFGTPNQEKSQKMLGEPSINQFTYRTRSRQLSTQALRRKDCNRNDFEEGRRLDPYHPGKDSFLQRLKQEPNRRDYQRLTARRQYVHQEPRRQFPMYQTQSNNRSVLESTRHPNDVSAWQRKKSVHRVQKMGGQSLLLRCQQRKYNYLIDQ